MLSLMIVSDLLSTESGVLLHESLSIFIVRQVLISEFLTVNDFLLKLDVSQFVDELCLVRSYHNIAGRCKAKLVRLNLIKAHHLRQT